MPEREKLQNRQSREPYTFDEKRRQKFLDSYKKKPSITDACKAAGIVRQTYYQTIEREPEFKRLVELAGEEATEVLEAVAWEKATKEKDNTSLWNLLKAHAPQKYRDPVQRYAQTDSEGNDRNDLSDDDLVARAQAIIKKREAGAP